LAEGWRWVTLKDIAQIVGGVTKGQKRRPKDVVRQVPYLRVANVQRGYLDLREMKEIESSESEIKALSLQPGDILFNEGGDRDKLGRGWVWNGELPVCVHQNHVFRARLKNSEDQPKFISFYGNSEGQRYFMEQGKQTTNLASINLTKLGALPIPLPPPDDQRRIVAEIEKQFTRLDAGVAALRRAQANLKRYRAAVLKAACEGRLVPTEAELARAEGRPLESGPQLLARILTERRQKWQGRGKYKEPNLTDTNKVDPLPKGWCWLSIETVAFVTKLAGFEYTKFVKYDPNGDLAVVKAENAGLHGFKRTNFSRVKRSTVAELTRSQIKPRDLLMVFVGNVGNVAMVPDDQQYFLGPNIAMMRVQSIIANPAYLEMFLRSPVGRSLTMSFVKAVAQPSLSMGTIRMIPVALPPLAEQNRIVAEVERRLSVVEELEVVVTANLQRATRLRQSILQKAFSGELIS